MTYPANNLPVLHCWRCQQPAEVEWCDVSSYAPQGEVMLGRMTCSTPGCLDEHGTAATSDTPPSPTDLQRKAKAAMDRLRGRGPSVRRSE